MHKNICTLEMISTLQFKLNSAKTTKNIYYRSVRWWGYTCASGSVSYAPKRFSSSAFPCSFTCLQSSLWANSLTRCDSLPLFFFSNHLNHFFIIYQHRFFLFSPLLTPHMPNFLLKVFSFLSYSSLYKLLLIQLPLSLFLFSSFSLICLYSLLP